MVYKNNILSTVLDMSRSSQSVSSLIALISWDKLLWPIEQNVTLKFFLFLGQHIIDDASSNDLKSQKDVDFESFHFQGTLWTSSLFILFDRIFYLIFHGTPTNYVWINRPNCVIYG